MTYRGALPKAVKGEEEERKVVEERGPSAPLSSWAPSRGAIEDLTDGAKQKAMPGDEDARAWEVHEVDDNESEQMLDGNFEPDMLMQVPEVYSPSEAGASDEGI